MNAVFKEAQRKLWRSLQARHNGKSKYGPCPITREQFTQWLWEKSESGLSWKCEYTGNVIQLLSKTAAGRLTIDHQVPLAKGGTSHLSNLAVCSEEANKVKGALCLGYYGRLMACMATWPPEEREEVVRRLKAYEPIYRRRR